MMANRKFLPSLFRIHILCFLSVVGILGVLVRTCEAAPALSLSRTRVYGPGVHPKRSNLPINYFYIQAVDTAGNK